jgi:lysozyme family protein
VEPVQTNFEACLKFVLKEEGGDDDDPRDPGGRTSRGITQREYNAWQFLHHAATGDVWKADDATVKAIYQQSYWLPYCDALPAGLDLLYFDMNVNMGMHESTLLLQRGLGVTADGHFGIVTMAAIRQTHDLVELLKLVSTKREDFYKGLRTFRTFGKGWTGRVDRCLHLALTMAGGTA